MHAGGGTLDTSYTQSANSLYKDYATPCKEERLHKCVQASHEPQVGLQIRHTSAMLSDKHSFAMHSANLA